MATPLRHISLPALVCGVFSGNSSLDNVVPKDTFETVAEFQRVYYKILYPFINTFVIIIVTMYKPNLT